MAGKAPFPAIDDRPYQITLGPYGFYWLHLEKPPPVTRRRPGTSLVKIPQIQR